MADLCSGISYGLSQSGANNDHNTKELIFVKLTDSAYRAIEEYHKNQKKLSTPSTIQFLGNSGTISFPSSNGGANFQFSIAETEGLMQGSFECIQQAQNQLEVLGALPHKIRIHAKEDVYEATRHRWAAAEETQKNKCIREIKGPGGRKVKQPPTASRINIPNNISTLNKQRDSSSSSSLSSSLSSASAITAPSAATNAPLSSSSNNNNSNNHHNNNNSSSNSLNNILSNSYNSLSGLGSTANTNTSSSSSLTAAASAAKSASPSVKNHVNGSGFSSSASTLSNGIGSAANGTTNGYSGAGTPPTYNTHNGNNNHHHNGVSDRSHAIPSVNHSSSNNINHSSMPIATNHSQQYNYNNSISQTLPNGTGSMPSRVTGSNGGSNGSNGRTPDIAKRPIKERLIHMLALKPYKKPELYSRLKNEGIRDRDSKVVATLLKSISVMRDNVYILNRYIWNDVHEDWPFYNEQERQSLKRRKPQNLTPPVSSDGGSSTSGQSPTSTHNGSPPPPVKRPSMNGEKYSEGPNAKKPRISHCQKDSNRLDSYSSANDYVKASTKNRRGMAESRDSPVMLKSRSRDSQKQQGGGDVDNSNGYYSSSVTPTSNAAESSAEENGPRLNFTVLSPGVASRISEQPTVTIGMHHQPAIQLQQIQAQSQLDSGSMMDAQALRAVMSNVTDNEKYDFSDYTHITSIEQRRRYKTEFDSDYSDYRKLHKETELVSQRFAQMGESLRQFNQHDARYKEIQKQIFDEYQKSMVDSRHQEKKKRFQYLHHKLSHIKKLVNDFDQSITNGKMALGQNY